MKNKMRFKGMILFVLIAMLPVNAMGHGQEVHNTPSDNLSVAKIAEKPPQSMESMEMEAHQRGGAEVHPMEHLAAIRERYLASVGAILEEKCADCHGGETELPWYSVLPGIKQLIQKDVAEGTKHLDLTGGFPFGGHGTAEDDLKALRKVAMENTMPPLKYKVLHWDSSLTQSDRERIRRWAEDGLASLKRLMDCAPRC